MSTALPPRRPDGTLPPGRHQIATLGDLLAAFPATTPKRQALNAAPIHLVDVVRRLALAAQVVIDGSYLTWKPDPEDVDVALLSTGAREMVTLQRLQQEGVDLTLLDVFVETTAPRFDNWITFYSADRLGNARSRGAHHPIARLTRRVHMRDVQPPITNDQELAGYRAGLERFNAIVAEREAALFASQHDPQRLEEARQELYRVYARRQGILDAIAAYERQHGASSTQHTA
ncbi:MAG: DUF6932 family protein [Ktedonobacterales bacterium]